MNHDQDRLLRLCLLGLRGRYDVVDDFTCIYHNDIIRDIITMMMMIIAVFPQTSERRRRRWRLQLAFIARGPGTTRFRGEMDYCQGQCRASTGVLKLPGADRPPYTQTPGAAQDRRSTRRSSDPTVFGNKI